MAPALRDFPSVQDIDTVSVPDGGQTVGNDDQGPCKGQPVNTVPYLLFALHIHAGSCLIKNNIFSLAQKRPGDSDFLPLPAGQPAAAIAHIRKKTVRLFQDPVLQAHLFKRLKQFLLRSILLCNPQVVGNGSRKHADGLRNHDNMLSKLLGRKADIVPAFQYNPSACRVKKAHEKPGHRTFAAAGKPGQGSHLSPPDCQ